MLNVDKIVTLKMKKMTFTVSLTVCPCVLLQHDPALTYMLASRWKSMYLIYAEIPVYHCNPRSYSTYRVMAAGFDVDC